MSKATSTTESPTDVGAILAKEAPDDVLGELLRQCLTATTTSKSGVVEPDMRLRLEALKLAAAYRWGLPVRREEVVTVNFDADAAHGIVERLRNSPALRKALRAQLEAAERDDPPPVDV